MAKRKVVIRGPQDYDSFIKDIRPIRARLARGTRVRVKLFGETGNPSVHLAFMAPKGGNMLMCELDDCIGFNSVPPALIPTRAFNGLDINEVIPAVLHMFEAVIARTAILEIGLADKSSVEIALTVGTFTSSCRVKYDEVRKFITFLH